MWLGAEKVLFSAHFLSIDLNNSTEASENSVFECRNALHGDPSFKEFQFQNWRGEAELEHPQIPRDQRVFYRA
jgi:hypothetical protein